MAHITMENKIIGIKEPITFFSQIFEHEIKYKSKIFSILILNYISQIILFPLLKNYQALV